MKKVLKIAGIAALAIILVCNLEYALFTGDMKNTPNKALADWWSGSVHYCGSSPNNYSRTGYWQYWGTDQWAYYHGSYAWKPVYTTYGYTAGFYLFSPDNSGTDCGPVRTSDCCGTNTASGWYNPYPAPYYTTTQTGGWGPY
jgi:hypothetical protein